MAPIRVLFICRGNSARSPMAEGFLLRYGRNRFEVQSAGTAPEPMDPLAVDVMRRGGVDISAHRPQDVAALAGQTFDFVITVCDDAREACLTFGPTGRLIHWRFEDPAAFIGTPEERRRVFMRVRDEIAGRIRLFAYAQTRHQDALLKEAGLHRVLSEAAVTI